MIHIKFNFQVFKKRSSRFIKPTKDNKTIQPIAIIKANQNNVLTCHKSMFSDTMLEKSRVNNLTK